jgi:hypothetical protein
MMSIFGAVVGFAASALSSAEWASTNWKFCDAPRKLACEYCRKHLCIVYLDIRNGDLRLEGLGNFSVSHVTKEKAAAKTKKKSRRKP